jgi:hypothetical protein
MGIKSYSIESIYKKKYFLNQYENLPTDLKEMIDFTIQENLKSNPELRLYGGLSIIKPKQTNFWVLSWSDIIELKDAISESNILAAFKIIYAINEKQFKRIELFNGLAVYKFIIESVKEIIKIENQELAHELSIEEKDAGAEKMQEFGYSATLDGLTNGDLRLYDEYLNMPYSKIFRKMCLDKTRYDINKQFQENASRKNKAHH